jgi:hypothetical protein
MTTSPGKKNKRITLEGRKKIEELLHENVPRNKICEIVGIWRTTLYRELKRCKDAYNAEEAQKTYGRSKNLIDFEIIGKKFGHLTVIAFANIYEKRSWWRCQCDCGKTCITSRKMLMERCSERRKLSCGCVPKQYIYKDQPLPYEEACLRKYEDMLKFRKIEGDCWEWTGYMQNGKVPKTSFKNKGLTARKCMWMIYHGLEWETNNVYTTCGNLLCFNPEHLTCETPIKRQLWKDQ